MYVSVYLSIYIYIYTHTYIYNVLLSFRRWFGLAARFLVSGGRNASDPYRHIFMYVCMYIVCICLSIYLHLYIYTHTYIYNVLLSFRRWFGLAARFLGSGRQEASGTHTHTYIHIYLSIYLFIYLSTSKYIHLCITCRCPSTAGSISPPGSWCQKSGRHQAQTDRHTYTSIYLYLYLYKYIYNSFLPGRRWFCHATRLLLPGGRAASDTTHTHTHTSISPSLSVYMSIYTYITCCCPSVAGSAAPPGS